MGVCWRSAKVRYFALPLDEWTSANFFCTAIEARNQQAALELHLQMLTLGSSEVTSFQAALKLVIQRMAV